MKTETPKSKKSSWGMVALIMGTTDKLCERCGIHHQEVIVRSQVKDHAYCKGCLGVLVSIAIGE